MANVIKKVKIKQADGTYTDYIPIGAEASNVITEDGMSVENKLNKKPYYFNNVEEMKNANYLKNGDVAITLGYYEANDGGNGEYKIINGNYENNNGGYFKLNNNLFAELLIYNHIINIKQFGAKNDNLTDNTKAIQNAIDYSYEHNRLDVFIPNGEYKLSHLEIYGKIKVYGENKNFTILQSINDNRYNSFINISGIGTSLKHITINGTSDGIYREGEHVENGMSFTSSKESWAGRLKIEDMTISNFNGTGIYQTENINGYLADSIFKDLKITNNEGHGIYIDSNSDFNIQDCFIAGNRLTGMYIKGASVRILNCKSYLNGVGYESEIVEGKPTRYPGIHISSFGSSIIGCHAQENYGHGFQIDNCTSCSINDNISDANGIIGFEDDYNLNNKDNSKRKVRTSSTLTNEYAGFYFNNAQRINASGLVVLSFINTNTYGVQMAYAYYLESFDGVMLAQGSVDNTSLLNSNININETSTIIINNKLYGSFKKFIENNVKFNVSDIITGTTGSFKLHIPNFNNAFIIIKLNLGNSKIDTIALTCGRTNNGINANKVSTQNWWSISEYDTTNGTITISITQVGIYGVNSVVAI